VAVKCHENVSVGPLPPRVTFKSSTYNSVTLSIQKSPCTERRQGFTYKFNVSYFTGMCIVLLRQFDRGIQRRCR